MDGILFVDADDITSNQWDTWLFNSYPNVGLTKSYSTDPNWVEIFGTLYISSVYYTSFQSLSYTSPYPATWWVMSTYLGSPTANNL